MEKLVVTAGEVSAQLIIIALIALGSAIAALVLRVRETRIASEVEHWIVQHRRADWEALPWLYRRFFSPTVAARHLRKSGRISELQYEELMTPVRRCQLQQLVCLAAAAVCIGLLFLGGGLLRDY